MFSTEETKHPKNSIALPINYWDLINAVTDFASHDYKILTFKEREDLQSKAYKMLEKTPDLKRFSMN